MGKQVVATRNNIHNQPASPEQTANAGSKGIALAQPTYGPAPVELQPLALPPPPMIQAKLNIGAPGDQYERQADQVAAQVVQRLHAPVTTVPPPDELTQPPEKLAKAKKVQMKPLLQLRSSAGSLAASPVVEETIQRLQGRGQPLAAPVRQPLERAFGADFSGVRVHTGVQADQLNRDLQAQAFTTGQDLFFRQGVYQPGSRAGQELLAHELTHVVQQNGYTERQFSKAVAAKAVTPQLLTAPLARGLTPAPVATPVIQRAIAIGTFPLPRSEAIIPQTKEQLESVGLWDKFRELNDQRDTVYIFDDEQHLYNYLNLLLGRMPPGSVHEPLRQRYTGPQLTQGHQIVQDIRFTNLFQPGVHQFPNHAPGVHTIDPRMMPPVGLGHMYARGITTASGVQAQYGIFANANSGPTPTIPHTFGDPNRPTVTMSQGTQNLGHIFQPTTNPAYFHRVARPNSQLGGIVHPPPPAPPTSDRVIGHVVRLEQMQFDTSGSGESLDTVRLTFTDESSSTQHLLGYGGTSTWRSNQIENPAIRTNTPFTQVNVNPGIGPMGISQPTELAIRRPNATMASGYDDMRMDNTGATDFRNAPRPPGVAQQEYQTTMGRTSAVANPYPEPRIHEFNQDFDDSDWQSEPYYQYPPPTPFVADRGLSATHNISLPGNVQRGTRVPYNGVDCLVIDVIAFDILTNTTACVVQEVPTVGWPM